MDSESFPAPEYAETVLAPNFEDAKKFFLDSLICIHYAHTRMLAAQGIITGDDERTLIGALRGLDLDQIANSAYDAKYEDLFFYIESLLAQAARVDVAGKMHTARSRNDIAIALYRMTVRSELLHVAESIAGLRATVLGLALRNIETIMPAHTHTQPAQPTTLGHYLLAAAEFLGRDAARVRAAFARVNLSPLGACAITTTGFPIDRDMTARLLGFEGLAENAYGAIAAIDYVTESASAVAIAMVNLGKLVHDLLLWSTREFGYLRLGDGYVQTSTIMPQKRNPVALEHVRILASRALGEAQAVLTSAHNTPFGDINDSEDDLQPLVVTMFGDARRALRLVAGVLRSAEVDRELMGRRARRNFLTVTELADTLVRRAGMSFREAHSLVAKTVALCGSRDDAQTIAATILSLKPTLGLTPEEIEQTLDPEHFVRIRTIAGGPAPETVTAALSGARIEQRELEEWISAKASLLKRNRAALLGLT